MTRRVELLALGGTIAMTRADDHGGVTPTLSAQDIAASVGVPDTIHLEARTLSNLPGASLTMSDVVSLARDVARALDAGANGVVVTQGTDTLEETAFALDLLLPPGRPVVVTGAMRAPSLPGSDASANLAAAVRVAASDAAAGVGAVVCMNGEIHAARYVQKTHTSDPAAFRSALGPIGHVVEEDVMVPLRPHAQVHLDLSLPVDCPPVALVRLGLGDDGRILRALPQLGFAGAVLEMFGAGHVPSWLAEIVTELTRRLPLVGVSRTGRGQLFRGTYGFPGSERDLRERGVTWGGDLDGLKARVLLTLLLGAGHRGEEIRAAFDRFGPEVAR